MYPATFPKNAPYLRIINPNTNEFAPTMMYLPLQSKTDTKSYVLNEKLESVKKWNSSTSVVRSSLLRSVSSLRLIISSRPIFRSSPFRKCPEAAYYLSYIVGKQSNKPRILAAAESIPESIQPIQSRLWAKCQTAAHSLPGRQLRK